MEYESIFYFIIIIGYPIIWLIFRKYINRNFIHLTLPVIVLNILFLAYIGSIILTICQYTFVSVYSTLIILILILLELNSILLIEIILGYPNQKRDKK